MNLFYLISNKSILLFTFRNFSMQPFIVSGSGNSAKFTKCSDWIIMFFVFFFDCLIYMFMTNQAYPRLLSISSSFFKKDASISARAFSAFKILTSARSFSNSLISSGCFRLPRLSLKASTPPASYLTI